MELADASPELATVRPPAPPSVVIGVCLADLQTPPAIVAAKQRYVCVSPGDPMYAEPAEFVTHYDVLDAVQLAAGTAYVGACVSVCAMAKRLYDQQSGADFFCLLDASGFGSPALQYLRDTINTNVHVGGVTVNMSDTADDSLLYRDTSTVGVSWLISRLQAAVGELRVVVPEDSMLAAPLLKLGEYRVEESKPDLIRALALCCCSSYRSIVYGPPVDSLPSPRW